MPGIYGLVTAGPTSDLGTLLGKMAVRLKHHDWYIEHRHLDLAAGVALGRTSLGFVNRAPQPAPSEDGSLLAMMEGEVYDYADQRRQLETAGHTFHSDSHAELLLHGFEQHGTGFFRAVHGAFVAALWDGKAGRLCLVNDRFGMKPLYYAHLPGRFLFASELKALLADPDLPRKTSRRGVAQFFAFGQLLGEETLLDGIRYLPQACVLTYDARDSRLSVEPYWRLEGEGPAGGSESEVVDRLDAAFKRAVDRCAVDTERLGLSLSGGMDARTILAVLDHPNVPLTTVTLGMEGSIDQRSSTELARLVGCRHHNYTLDARFLADYEQHMRRLVWLTDGHYQSQCITMPTLPLYRELGIEVLLRGHAGELMHMTKAYNFSLDPAALAIRDEGALESWLAGHLHAFVSSSSSGSLYAEEIRAEMDELARDSLRTCLRGSAHLRPPVHRIWHLFLTQRLRRETALSLVEFGSVVETRLPYLDPELVELLFAVPPELKLRDTIQTYILRKRRPAFLDVINVNTGARVVAGDVERLVAKARLKILAKLGVKGYQPYERLGRWLREALRPFVTELLLSDRSLGRGLFNPQTVRSVVENHLNGRQNHTFLLLALMIFELGQRQFVESTDDESSSN